MNITRKLLAAGATVALVAGALLGTAIPASAHTPNITGNCTQISVKANAYDANVLNKFEVIVNGSVIDSGTFGASLNKTYPVAGNGATTVWSAHIEAADGSYPGNGGGTLTCGTPTIIVPNVDVAPPTCAADGYLPFLAASSGPAQNANGYEFLGKGYRAYLSKAYPGTGQYTINFQKIGAGFDPAFPNGTKVGGNVQQVVTVLPRLGQDVDPNAPCFEGPGEPENIVTVEVTEGLPNCVTKQVAVNTTTTTIRWSYNSETKSWDKGEPVSETVVTYRDLKPNEVFDCTPVPEPIYYTIYDSNVDCVTGIFKQTWTDYQQDPVWDAETLTYGFGEAYDIGYDESNEPATVAQLDAAECPLPELPADEVKTTTTTAGVKCGDTKAVDTTVTVTTPYKYVDRVAVLDHDNAVTETVVTERDPNSTEAAAIAKDCPIIVVDLPNGEELVVTGADLELPLWTAFALLLAGLGLIVAHNRRNAVPTA